MDMIFKTGDKVYVVEDFQNTFVVKSGIVGQPYIWQGMWYLIEPISNNCLGAHSESSLYRTEQEAKQKAIAKLRERIARDEARIAELS